MRCECERRRGLSSTERESERGGRKKKDKTPGQFSRGYETDEVLSLFLPPIHLSSLFPLTLSLSCSLVLVMHFSLFRIPSLTLSFFLSPSLLFFPLFSTGFPFAQASVQACLSLSYKIPTALCFVLGCGIDVKTFIKFLVVRIERMSQTKPSA